ncbi:hypothetical protein BJP36_36790 [Moorena producens JHB]|uniref:Uncharacterized protein n=1 Tax=Moorena producens (strain JHB) TaxID=1454205 RepID=A0A9Q9UW88_MOOP1|nr:hypothetical protein [Moorena producens]WAN69650.1 hypothetical protein BJP36_36790 [Moorena producens JHB]
MSGVDYLLGEQYFVCDRTPTSDRCARATEKSGAVLENWSQEVS